ncbi:MAG TPA: hypothetical protein VJ714_06910 [Anaerolineae bacterium]|nr:hypothetical protein [Anaerolineae bacterium]
MANEVQPSVDPGMIHPDERDYGLRLNSDDWGTGLNSNLGWRVTPTPTGATKYLTRTISVDEKGKTSLVRRDDHDSPDQGNCLTEAIVRFPAAPIYQIHREQQYTYTIEPRIYYQTMRLLRRPWSDDPRRAKRIYLFHHGLNEIDRLGFYYQLANLILDEDSVCIIRALPAHLMRSPFPGEYAEKPLDRYLADAGDLLRQFLRFMLETQWFLSAVVSLPDYRVVSGMNLLASGKERSKSRQDPGVLANAIYNAWQSAYSANALGPCDFVKADHIRTSVEALRDLTGWEPTANNQDGPPPKNDLPPPALHSIGYSMGGYLAQSVFFSWPFVVASCTTIGSGGPLREVALTEFAHPEEWQSVMYALRFEIENAMLLNRLVRSGNDDWGYFIAGINEDYYAFLDRIFNDVFLQDFRGAYRQRVSEYAHRLLFVLGGMDPVISTRSVIESSPPGGINMIQIANLSHFLWRDQGEWRRFWLPRVAAVVGAFSHRTEEILAESLNENWDLLKESEPDVPPEDDNGVSPG